MGGGGGGVCGVCVDCVCCVVCGLFVIGYGWDCYGVDQFYCVVWLGIQLCLCFVVFCCGVGLGV